MKEVRENMGGWGRPPQVVSPQIVRCGMVLFHSSTSHCLGAPIHDGPVGRPPATHGRKQNRLICYQLLRSNKMPWCNRAITIQCDISIDIVTRRVSEGKALFLIQPSSLADASGYDG